MRSTAAHPRALLASLLLAAALAPPAPAQGGAPTPVRVDPVRSERVVERRQVTGDVRAVHRSDVAAREKGIVIALAVREGQVVAAGDVLAEQDASNLELELAVLRAQVAPAEAAVREAQADLEQRRSDLAALEKLRERAAAQPKELSDARTAVAAAEAREARAAAQLDVLSAQITQLSDRIDDMVVRAPFAGTVTRRLTEVGAWLGEGQAVVELVSTSAVEVWLEVPQQHLEALERAETPVHVSVDATGEALELRDWRVVRDVARTSRTFRIVGAASDLSLAPGMSVTAEVPTGALADRLTVSRDALLRNAAGPYVYVVIPGAEDQPPSAAPVQVDVLFHLGERVAVRDGRLTAGARVVVEGNERLFPMAPIQPIESEAQDGPDDRGAGGQPTERVSGAEGETVGSAEVAGAGSGR